MNMEKIFKVPSGQELDNDGANTKGNQKNDEQQKETEAIPMHADNPHASVFDNGGQPLADHIRQKIVDLAKDGMKPCDISRRLQLSNGCISNVLAHYYESDTISSRPPTIGTASPCEYEQPNDGLATDGHYHNSSGANLLDGTTGATTSAVTAMAMQKADLFEMKYFCPFYCQTFNLETLQLADQKNNAKLIDLCIANVDPLEFVRDIGQHIEIRSRLRQSSMEKLDKMMRRCARRVTYKGGPFYHCRHSGCFFRFANNSDLQKHRLQHVHHQQRGIMTNNFHSSEAHGTLLLKVPTFAALKNDHGGQQNGDRTITSSTICVIGNLKWQLELRKGLNGKYALYANCNEKCVEHFWFCNAKFTINSTEEGGRQWTILTTDPMYAFYGKSQLLIAQAIDVTNKNWIIVDVDLLRVQPKMFALDTNIEVKMANGIKLVAVNKQGLASVSTYFYNFFFAQWKEKGQEEFVLHEEDDPSFDIHSFHLMIYAALSLSWMVPELLELFKEGLRMLDILKLSFKYDIPPFVEYCQKQLILEEKNYAPKLEIMELADQLNLTKLMDHCLANFNLLEFMKNIAQGIEIRAHLEKSNMEKMDEMLKECANNMEYHKKVDIAHDYNKLKVEDLLGTTKCISSKAQRLDIIEKTWLPDEQTKIWFQNRQMEEKEVIILGWNLDYEAE